MVGQSRQTNGARQQSAVCSGIEQRARNMQQYSTPAQHNNSSMRQHPPATREAQGDRDRETPVGLTLLGLPQAKHVIDPVTPALRARLRRTAKVSFGGVAGRNGTAVPRSAGRPKGGGRSRPDGVRTLQRLPTGWAAIDGEQCIGDWWVGCDRRPWAQETAAVNLTATFFLPSCMPSSIL